MQEKIKEFRDLTQDIVKFPTQEKQRDYLLLLNDLEFEFWELQEKVPVMKELLKNKINDRVSELVEEWLAHNKSTTQAELELQDEKVEYTTKDAFASHLKTLVNIGERTYYHTKRELEQDIKTEQQSSDLPF